MNTRANSLAERVERGANELIIFVEGCSLAEWQTPVPNDGRTVGVLAHHVASAYPVEVDLVKTLASGEAIAGVTWAMVDQMNAEHAQTHANCTKEETLTLLRQNSASAAAAIRQLSDEQLDKAAPVSLNWDAPLTAQYFIEEHPVSHPFRHLMDIRTAVNGKS
ncbi:MAG: maleylpyruvate isomerase N-terminal domain-containing protein [Anaerolineae bacterium]